MSRCQTTNPTVPALRSSRPTQAEVVPQRLPHLTCRLRSRVYTPAADAALSQLTAVYTEYCNVGHFHSRNCSWISVVATALEVLVYFSRQSLHVPYNTGLLAPVTPHKFPDIRNSIALAVGLPSDAASTDTIHVTLD